MPNPPTTEATTEELLRKIIEAQVIVLSNGMECFVSEADYERLSKWKWNAVKKISGYYASCKRWDTASKRYRHFSMHRMIMDAPKGTQVDHRNGNTLDNRRTNLRLCSSSQNHMNMRARLGHSRFKGVSMDLRKNGKKWRSYIQLKGRQVGLGYHSSEEEAAMAYNRAALKHFGAFARINDFETAVALLPESK